MINKNNIDKIVQTLHIMLPFSLQITKKKIPFIKKVHKITRFLIILVVLYLYIIYFVSDFLAFFNI